MLKKIIDKLDTHTLEVLVKSSKTMLVKVFGMITALLISIFLARTLGPNGLGVVNFSNKLGMILLILTMFGFQNVIIKFIAIAKEKFDNKGIATAVKTSLVFNLLISLCIACIGAIVLEFIFEIWPNNQELYVPLLIVFIMLIPQTISRVYGSALNGYGKIWQANLVDRTLSVILVGLGLILYSIFSVVFTPISVLLLYAISRVILAVVVKVMWNQTFKNNIKGRFNFKPMFKMAKPLLVVSGTGVIASNADVIMLGILGTLEDVGVYSVAWSLAMLTSIFLQVTNAAIAPKVASLYNDSKTSQLQVMVQSITKGLVIVGLLFITFFVVLGQWLLDFWGSGFEDAYWLIIILSIGQFFNMATGCAGMILVMCGFEKIHGYISIAAVILNIILNLFFILSYGAIGAAIATATTATFANLTKFIFVTKKLKISTIKFKFN